ncbi:entericidin EcnA/B family protein [Profundibacterium mesophilum]|uniref:Entericidin EcnAB n=1 Tax=Profundibacterium mesophilum KAUST100406-0324 TaxID=1037889 RepID=A0A921NTI8_9RHOB|nr:entericidin EcnA/B family protein [Profundibacterium mesophilum]KAF0675258.1 entericidin EcnAB [Profundibacterium mesophilum KAUST100406-0324]
MKKMTAFGLVAAMLILSACNTATGVAKDVWGGTKYVGKKITEDDKPR